MKFVVSSLELLNNLSAIGKAIANKSQYQVLECFLLDLQGTTLKMTASDLEVTMTTQMEVDSSGGDGVIALPSRILLETLRNFPEQPLTFNITEDTLSVEVVSERGTKNFIAFPAEDFPVVPEIDEEGSNKIELSASTLLTGINKTLFATADDDLRPVMNGILIEIKNDHLTFVASDSHKLVRYRREDIKNEIDVSFILPKKPAGLLKSVLPKEVGDVTISFDEKNAFFQMPNYQLVCRLIEGNYPMYSAVIPQNNTYRIIVDRVDLSNALKLVSPFASSSKLVKISLSTDKMVVSAQDLDLSLSGLEELSCQYENDDLDIGFKVAFLSDILDNISSADIIVEMNDPTRAALILPFDKQENEDELMLLMPMQINT
ncbi:MAG: DNA polymerase III subunit beta [Marinilabiliaceae bacterium]|nr:DNA polymerase III subunit beta [Marinilabiliaceae bacterium]